MSRTQNVLGTLTRSLDNFDGVRPIPPQPLLWSFQHRVIILNGTGAIVTIQPFPPPGPLLTEWFYLEADPRNLEEVLIGEGNVGQNPGASGLEPPSFNCITVLFPGDGALWEPNDRGAGATGFITHPDGTLSQIAETPDLDMLDLTQLFFQMGPGALPASLHATIGIRSKR